MRPPVLILCLIVLMLAGCGTNRSPLTRPATVPAALLAGARPVGAGPRFQPPTPDRPVSRCRPALGRRDGAHVELFARGRVVLLPAGIGTRPPRRLDDGRIVAARCYGPIVTLDPTGVVLVRRGRPSRLRDLFATWGVPLGRRRAASFAGAVAVFVDGRRIHGAPGSVALGRHAEVVIEVGPYVPPHRTYAFAPGV